MNPDEIAEVLAKPYAQQLLNGPEPARIAYDGLDGDPRVIPIGFWTEGDRMVIATLPKSAKVAALRNNPKVALTIDKGAFPPKVLLLRGTAEVTLVEGIPDGYLNAGRKVMTDDQYPDWVAGVQGLYDEMASSRSPRHGSSSSTSRPPSPRQLKTSSRRRGPPATADGEAEGQQTGPGGIGDRRPRSQVPLIDECGRTGRRTGQGELE